MGEAVIDVARASDLEESGMTLTDEMRLAQIRAQVEKWSALLTDARDWDSAFLLVQMDRSEK